MNLEVQKFLDSGANFTESSPRPPVPGEENELQSNGGTSTRSSGSHKSHLSTKSHTSSKSSRNEHSPAATPRRSNLERTGKTVGYGCREDEAPLGFEPEGSAANSPPFTENSTPSFLKWAENIQFLLDDSEGIRLFKQFLDQEQCSNQLSFYFACRGFKLVDPSDTGKVISLAKLIYRKYIKGDTLKLNPDTKREIADKIKQNVVDQHLLNRAQQEVYTCMEGDTYPLFLKSDLYVQYVQNGGESPKTSNTSSGSNSVLPISGLLPTLPEGEELHPEDLDTTAESSSGTTITLTEDALRITRYQRSMPVYKRRPEG